MSHNLQRTKQFGTLPNKPNGFYDFKHTAVKKWVFNILCFEISKRYKSYHNWSHFGLETLFLHKKIRLWSVKAAKTEMSFKGVCSVQHHSQQDVQLYRSAGLATQLLRSGFFFFFFPLRSSMQHLRSAEKDAPWKSGLPASSRMEGYHHSSKVKSELQ